MIYLGLDYGEKRIGVARSDETGLIAEPIGFISAVGYQKIKAELKKYLTESGVSQIVVGLPITTKNEIGKQAQAALEFVVKLKKDMPCEVVTWDERFTTKEADRILRETETAAGKRRERRDALAAQFMLQNYLDFQRMKGANVSNQQA